MNKKSEFASFKMSATRSQPHPGTHLESKPKVKVLADVVKQYEYFKKLCFIYTSN